MTSSREWHRTLWHYSDGYRLAWIIGPQALALAVVAGLFWPGSSSPQSSPAGGNWAKAPPPAIEWGRCIGGTAPPLEQIVTDCTRIISSGSAQGSDLANAYFRRANARNAMKDLDAALADYDEAARLAPGGDNVFINRGNIYYTRSQWAKAEADYSRAIEANPRSAVAYADRANARRMQGQLDDALADTMKAESLDKSLDHTFYVRMLIYENKGDWPAVISAATSLLQINPNDSRGYLSRGFAQMRLVRNDAARADIDKAAELGNTSQFIPLVRALLALRNNDAATTANEASRCLQIAPKEAECLTTRAYARIMQADYLGAQDDATAALASNPKTAEGYATRGRARAFLNQTDAALDDLAKAIEIAPRSAQFRYFRADAFRIGEEAAYSACPASRQSAGPSTVIGGGGSSRICAMGPDTETGIRYYNEALALEPGHPQALAGRGILYMIAKRRDLGEADLRKAASLAPGNAWIRSVLTHYGIRQ